jgi:hypothetical protein
MTVKHPFCGPFLACFLVESRFIFAAGIKCWCGLAGAGSITLLFFFWRGEKNGVNSQQFAGLTGGRINPANRPQSNQTNENTIQK